MRAKLDDLFVREQSVVATGWTSDALLTLQPMGLYEERLAATRSRAGQPNSKTTGIANWMRALDHARETG